MTEVRQGLSTIMYNQMGKMPLWALKSLPLVDSEIVKNTNDLCFCERRFYTHHIQSAECLSNGHFILNIVSMFGAGKRG